MIDISIIVPIYNVEKYVEKCVDSILKQTYINFELILVDDGSTDMSGKICDKFKKEDDRIKVIHKKNGGLSSARNEGVKLATGKYIGFIDSDDYIDKTMYEKMFNKAIEDDSDIVICDMTYNLNGKDISTTIFEDFGVLNREDTILKYLENDYFRSHAQNKLYKRELFEYVSFPEGKLYEDVATFYKLIHNCNKISFVNEKLYYYNQSNYNSITKKKFNINNLQLILNTEEMKDFFIRNNYTSEIIRKVDEFYFIQCILVMQMLINSSRLLNIKEFLYLELNIIHKIDFKTYNRGLYMFYKNKKCNYFRYELLKKSIVFILCIFKYISKKMSINLKIKKGINKLLNKCSDTINL